MDKKYYDLQDRISRAMLWIDALQQQNSIVQKNMDKKSAQKIIHNNNIKIQRLQRLINKTEQDLDRYQRQKSNHKCRIISVDDYQIDNGQIIAKKNALGQWMYLGTDPPDGPGPVA